jgi:hypothetical protein
MGVQPVFLVIIDISGYTRFIQFHRSSLLHAERIICDLLESVIDCSTTPLVVHEILGDAVTFYATSDGSEAMANAIRRQVNAFFATFRAREAKLISDCSLCLCDACSRIGSLKLKAVLHHGEAVFNQVSGFQKIAGEDVILAHRLLKNSISMDEYILESESFYNLGGESIVPSAETRTEICEGLGAIQVKVYPPHEVGQPVAAVRSRWDRLKRSMRNNLYLIRRLFIGPSRRFRNLDAAQTD